MSHHRGPSASAQQRTRSRSPAGLSRPTTPLRPSSRTSFRASSSASNYHNYNGGSASLHGDADATESPLDALEPQFAELADSMADLEANFMHLQLMHESLARFGESFAGFLYGLNMNAFVVDFPEAPEREGIKRWGREMRRREREREGIEGETTVLTSRGAGDETTLGTGDVSVASMKATPRRKSVAPMGTPGTTSTSRTTGEGRSGIPSVRGGTVGRGARGAARGGRASGLPRGRGRAAK